MSKLGTIVKTTKQAADTAKKAVAKASPTRLELGKRGKARQKSEQVQKAYDRIQGEIKYLRENEGSPESIALRNKALKDMKVTHLIKPKNMEDVKPRVPAEMASDIKSAQKEAELDADVAKVMEALQKRKPQNKARGGVVKSRTGAHDYRMNKGGLLLSSVDNRKKR